MFSYGQTSFYNSEQNQLAQCLFNRHETLIQCWYNAGPASQTLVVRLVDLYNWHIVHGRSLRILLCNLLNYLSTRFDVGYRSN